MSGVQNHHWLFGFLHHICFISDVRFRTGFTLTASGEELGSKRLATFTVSMDCAGRINRRLKTSWQAVVCIICCHVLFVHVVIMPPLLIGRGVKRCFCLTSV